MTGQKLLQLSWEVLIHPLYSPNIAPLDFHLFQPLQSYLNRKKFNSLENWKKYLGRWNYEVAQKITEGSGTQQWIHCSMKLLVIMKNVSFSVTLKPNELFGQPNMMVVNTSYHTPVKTKGMCNTKNVLWHKLWTLDYNHVSAQVLLINVPLWWQTSVMRKAPHACGQRDLCTSL